MQGLVQEDVNELLEHLSIDYLGVSLDALLITARPADAPAIMDPIRDAGVRIHEIGTVESGESGAFLRTEEGLHDFTPRFREAAYTPVKKVVDTREKDFTRMKRAVEDAALAALEKKERMIRRLRRKEQAG
ncbi:MAG: hypothetical protein A4E42_00346 [Methanoregulaceae archaeon PtaU1.Bin222]|nr:MAG: hypothetical protein A4E42_00346 [Methanoregulaceae archaeon PtaU1.Bin222]